MSESDFKLVKPIAITDAKLISSSIPEPDTGETLWNAASAYAVGDKVIRPTTHMEYERKVAGTTATAPESDATNWLPLGSSNRYRMFDKAVNSQSSAAETITVTIATGELNNTLTILNVSGTSVTVTQTESGYSKVKSLVHHDVGNWYDWFYTEPQRAGSAVFDDIPPYKTASVTITVDNPDGTAAIGCCFIGRAYTLGTTLWELTGGILSYSTTTTDTFGNTTMVKRANAKRLNFDVMIPAGYESVAYNLLTRFTDEELVVIGTTEYEMAVGYGFLGQWEVPVSNSGKPANIEFKGLI